MGLDRDTALVEDAGEAQRLTAIAGLLALEEDDELSVDSLLLEAHRWLYDWLRNRWTAAQLATVTNTDALKQAEAFRFAEVVAAAGLLTGDAGTRAADTGTRDYYGQQAREILGNWRPEFPAVDIPRNSQEGVPVMRNLVAGASLFHYTLDPEDSPSS